MPGREHHAGLGARHQRHEPRRDRHARDRPARAARRPQPLSGLLRLRDVGLPAGEPERDQADRSHPRPGVGGLGRQRAQRRRQRDHQVAARDAGDERDARLRRLRPHRTTRGSPGSLWYVSGTHAQAINDRWAFKLSAGGYSQDPLSRPTGTIPCSPPSGHAQLSRVHEQGTTQPKFDGRVDYDYPDGSEAVVLGRRRRHRRHHAHRHRAVRHQQRLADGVRPGELPAQGAPRGRVLQHPRRRRDQPARPRPHGRAHRRSSSRRTRSTSRRRTCRRSATRHVVSYGGNLRFNTFDLSIAPQSDNRTEFGVYAQDEIFLSNQFRWTSARASIASTTSTTSCSRRATTFMIKPQENQTFRVSYNRAYRSPSVINNFLDVTLTEPLPPRAVHPALGEPDLPAPDPPRRQPGPEGDVARRVRDRLHGRRRAAGRCSRRRST